MKHIGTLAILLYLLLSPHRVVAETEFESAVKRLSAPEDYNRSRAARAIGQMGNDAISAFDTLYEVALSDDVPKVRHAAASALGKIAHAEAVNRFIRELQTNSVATVREYCVDALMEHPLRSPEATVPLFQALRDENEKVRGRAGIALQFYRNEELEKLLLESLSNPTDKAREWAPWLLGRMHSQAALSPLHDLLTDKSIDFRKSVVAALRDIQSKTSVPPLIEVVKHDDSDEVRMRAIQCLGELGDQKAAATVVAALDDDNPEVRAYAAGAVGTLGVEEAKPRLREILKEVTGRETLAAMGALCQMKDTNSIPIIMSHLNTTNEFLSLYMMRALVELEAESEIIQLKDHAAPFIRSAAEESLKKLQKKKDIQQDKSSVRGIPRR